MTGEPAQREVQLRLDWVRCLAMLAVAERDGLEQVERLRGRRAELEAAIADRAGRPGPMAALAARLELAALQVDFLWAAVAATTDPKLAVHVEALGGSPTRRGLGVNLFARLVELDEAAAWQLAMWLARSNRLVAAGLLVASDDSTPAVRGYAVAPRLIAHLAGVGAPEPGLRRITPPDPAALVLDDAQRLVLDDLARVVQGEAPVLVILEGARGTGRTSAVAQAVGGAVIELDCAAVTDLPAALAALGRETALVEQIAVIANLDHAGEAGQRAVAAALRHHRGPVVVTAVTLGSSLAGERPAVRLRWPVPDGPARRRLWSQVATIEGDVDGLAHRYRIGPGTIARAAESARLLAGATARLDAIALTGGLRHNIAEELGDLAQRVEVTQTWDDLVLAEDTREQIDALVARVRHSHQVLERWGYRSKMARGTGVPALFSGPPGTGKTMVAGLVARELDLELYQVDLSQVVSKWVGETEKQLARVFDAAEQGHGLLLFDEADALFGQRSTEVKGAVDRYANLEVNYLLQRVEAFGGITILTTNLDAGIDRALKRRLAAHVVFDLPDEDERIVLWRRLTGTATAPLGADVDAAALARAFPRMSGAHIRNAALSAAFLAAAAGATTIQQVHLMRAGRGEYRSMGHELAGAARG